MQANTAENPFAAKPLAAIGSTSQPNATLPEPGKAPQPVGLA